MMEYHVCIVEGIHDVHVLQKVLRLQQFSSIQRKNELDPYWFDVLPKQYPTNREGVLYKRPDVPYFMEKDRKQIAIISANGEDNLSNVLKMLDVQLDLNTLSSISLFADADERTAREKYEWLTKQLRGTVFDSYIDANVYPAVHQENLRLGIYIFPDNKRTGTLEDVLLAGGEEEYPELMREAEKYIGAVENQRPKGARAKNFKGASRHKMQFGVMTNVFKPGKANQVSIADNDWISTQTVDRVESHQKLFTFIQQLIAEDS